MTRSNDTSPRSNQPRKTDLHEGESLGSLEGCIDEDALGESEGSPRSRGQRQARSG